MQPISLDQGRQFDLKQAEVRLAVAGLCDGRSQRGAVPQLDRLEHGDVHLHLEVLDAAARRPLEDPRPDLHGDHGIEGHGEMPGHGERFGRDGQALPLRHEGGVSTERTLQPAERSSVAGRAACPSLGGSAAAGPAIAASEASSIADRSVGSSRAVMGRNIHPIRQAASIR